MEELVCKVEESGVEAGGGGSGRGGQGEGRGMRVEVEVTREMKLNK